MVELEIFDYDVDKASLMGPAPYAAQFAAEWKKNLCLITKKNGNT